MASIVIRFPDGTREFRYPVEEINVGDVLSHVGQRYRVISIGPLDGGPQIVTVEPDSDDLKDLLQSEQGAIVLAPLEA